MNRANIGALIDVLENDRHVSRLGVGFNMRNFVFTCGEDLAPDQPDAVDRSGWHCGTVACLAGHAAIMAGWAVRDVACMRSQQVEQIGRDFLGLKLDMARLLFNPVIRRHNERDERWDALPREAARVLRHLLDTGAVDWSIVPATA